MSGLEDHQPHWVPPTVKSTCDLELSAFMACAATARCSSPLWKTAWDAASWPAAGRNLGEIWPTWSSSSSMAGSFARPSTLDRSLICDKIIYKKYVKSISRPNDKTQQNNRDSTWTLPDLSNLKLNVGFWRPQFTERSQQDSNPFHWNSSWTTRMRQN